MGSYNSATCEANIVKILAKKLHIPCDVAVNNVGNSVELALKTRVKLQLMPNLIVIMSKGIKPTYVLPTVRISKPPTVATAFEKANDLLRPCDDIIIPQNTDPKASAVTAAYTFENAFPSRYFNINVVKKKSKEAPVQKYVITIRF